MLSLLRAPQILILSLVAVSVLLGCHLDDDQAVSILPYNSQEHVYGTMSIDNGNATNKWEVVIDPRTGNVDTIPGTRVFGGGISFPLGTKNLNDFGNNRRIYIDIQRDLIIQDLETFATTIIELKDEGINRYVLNPQYLRFGSSTDELYLIDTDRSVWQIDLLAAENSVQKTELVLPLASGAYLSHFFYLADANEYVYTTNTSATNAGTINELVLYDPEQDMIIETQTIDESFGLVQHPDDENAFYFLQLPNGDEGFRLMALTVNGSALQLEQRSSADLPIDELSIYMQTIHTASHTYICRGGPSQFDMPTNTLYGIDLDSGELITQANLKIEGLLRKLAGE